jgi:hypothetical protein
MPTINDLMRSLEKLHDQHVSTEGRHLELNELQHRFDYACTTGQQFYGETLTLLESHLAIFLAHKAGKQALPQLTPQ